VPPAPHNDPRSDEQLVDALNRGDPSAFEPLYLRHKDFVYRLACRFTPDRDEALDVLQDAFTYFLGRFPGFSLRARLTTFLYPVVKNIALAGRRKRRRLRLGEVPEAAADAPLPARDGLGPLGAAVDALPDAQREVLLMRVVDGMSLQEVATALDIPAGTVKSRLHNALRALREDPRTHGYFPARDELDVPSGAE
jgi:RNA polymerase sigma-70 factor (ECF subfamily)